MEKSQTEPIQPKLQKNAFGLGCVHITFLLNRMVWFGLRFTFYEPNQTKPNQTTT